MKHLFSILLTLSLALPLAAADGVDASVDYLEADGEQCSASEVENSTYWSEWYNDEYGYWYAWNGAGHGERTAACSDDFTTAGASVDGDGAGHASANVGGQDGAGESAWYSESGSGSGYQYGWNESYSSGRNDHYDRAWGSSYYDSWSRSADVEAAGHSASAGRSCNSSSFEAGSSTSDSSASSSNYGSSSSEHYESASTTSSQGGCRDGADVDGVSAGRVEGCQGESSGRHMSDYGQYGDTSWSYSWYESRHSSSCRTGAEASAAGETVFAGSRSRCEDEGFGMSHENVSYERSMYSCNGAFFAVDGPDGLTFGIGHRDSGVQTCDGGVCESSYAAEAGVFVVWEHSPLGPMALEQYQPLP